MLRELLAAFVALVRRMGTRNRGEAIAAYCPDCGGQTLIRTVKNQKVYCPQCRA